ncbi:hypothetical protein TcarDRAFT_1295 [Thermosinus carboxydivorans Nor1]|uniref:Uncharacterized protein n=1 Tax=Thermosinus carboxydivorans Nor1 TaxID=401526 RepID=A1HR65_9FIRM|nr:anaerobic ribonucleoside-triphosphate reductase [Thermosinus carboxydivorans]EAX47560.1 hypothetical protein TcarDRAFT_1295 [Thermosinus carboxydivorans Nor1]
MPSWEIYSVKVTADEGISYEEAMHYVHEEQLLWKERGKVLGRMEIRIINDGLDVEIKTYERSPIRRVRRITGYLSTVDRFNDAKRAELADRVAHEYREALTDNIRG